MDLNTLIIQALQEDVGDGDHSSLAAIPAEAQGKARLLVKENGILAGVRVAEAVFHHLEPSAQLEIFIEDGAEISVGQVVFIISASVHTLLKGERLALNLMQRMSGIATRTRQYVQAIAGTNAKLLDTRKTTPCLRDLEKEAVRIGGGYNHRFGLYDMIMLKDNHVDFAGGIAAAIQKARTYLQTHHKSLKIEIEVRNLDELQQVLQCGGVDRIMLDNFSPDLLRQALPLIPAHYETEASGGITLDNILQYAETGVQYISVGALTHSVKSLDLSLKALR